MKTLLISFFLIFCTASCSGQNKSATTNHKPDFDSLLSSYKGMPTYYVNYGNTDCLFELRVNDVVVDSALS